MAQFELLRTIPGCEVTAIFDPKGAGLDRARARGATGVLTDDIDAFLESGIDAVSVCSPNHVHASQVCLGLAAGKHVICEKPLAGTIEDCEAILRAERAASGLVVAVQHQMRFVPLYGRAREAVRSGELGRVSYIEGYYVHNVTKRISLNDTWVRETAPAPLLLSGCHFVDLMRWVLDDEVVEVVGMGNAVAFPEYGESDLSVVLLRFRSGVLGKVVTAFAAGRPQDHSLRVLASERCIDNNLVFEKSGFVRYLTRPMFSHGLGARRNLRNRIGELVYDLRRNLKATFAHRLFDLGRRVYGRSDAYAVSAYPLRLYEHGHAVKRCLEDFIDCIRSGRRPRAMARDAALTVATCLAGVEAYRTGATVSMSRYGLDGSGQPTTGSSLPDVGVVQDRS
jgi:predicted dehydrogenase